MARVWVKGYTKDDGTKVKGHYRESEAALDSKIKYINRRILKLVDKRPSMLKHHKEFSIDDFIAGKKIPVNKKLRGLERQIKRLDRRETNLYRRRSKLFGNPFE